MLLSLTSFCYFLLCFASRFQQMAALLSSSCSFLIWFFSRCLAFPVVDTLLSNELAEPRKCCALIDNPSCVEQLTQLALQVCSINISDSDPHSLSAFFWMHSCASWSSILRLCLSRSSKFFPFCFGFLESVFLVFRLFRFIYLMGSHLYVLLWFMMIYFGLFGNGSALITHVKRFRLS